MSDDIEQPGVPSAPAPDPGVAAPVDEQGDPDPVTTDTTDTTAWAAPAEPPPASPDPAAPITSPLPPPMPPPIQPPIQPPPPSEPTWPLPPADTTTPMPPPATPLNEPATAETAVPFTYPGYGAPLGATADGTGPGTPTTSAGTGQGQGQSRRWLAVAVVAAVIGAGVGAGVTALTDNNNGSGDNVTIHESNATPGAAVLSGNVTIPQLVRDVIPAVVSIDVKSGQNEDQGTGMIITSDGEVVTNNHVIELFNQGGGTGSITVTEYGQKKSAPATLIGYNTQQDVALLKINNAS
jgi:putative serine protease PepD